MAKQDDPATSVGPAADPATSVGPAADPATSVGPAADPTRTPPGLVPRFGALIVDWALCVLVAGFIGDPVRQGWPPVLALIAEYGFFIGLFAQTPGMWLTRLRCVSFTDGGRIGVVRAALRGVLLCLVVPPLLMDERRRGLHDRVVGSIVVAACPPGTPRWP